MKKILCVDDEEDIRVILEYLFENEGYEVVTCSGGEESWAIAKTFLPHLIILDVMMPNIDGVQTLEGLKTHAATRHIPVVFLTAKSMPTELERLKQLDVLAVLTKPFDPTTLSKQLLILWQSYVEKKNA